MDRLERKEKLDRLRISFGMRCKNCRHWDMDQKYPYCFLNGHANSVNDYCTWFDWREYEQNGTTFTNSKTPHGRS